MSEILKLAVEVLAFIIKQAQAAGEDVDAVKLAALATARAAELERAEKAQVAKEDAIIEG